MMFDDNEPLLYVNTCFSGGLLQLTGAEAALAGTGGR